jgi:hypothetical protein
MPDAVDVYMRMNGSRFWACEHSYDIEDRQLPWGWRIKKQTGLDSPMAYSALKGYEVTRTVYRKDGKISKAVRIIRPGGKVKFDSVFLTHEILEKFVGERVLCEVKGKMLKISHIIWMEDGRVQVEYRQPWAGKLVGEFLYSGGKESSNIKEQLVEEDNEEWEHCQGRRDEYYADMEVEWFG